MQNVTCDSPAAQRTHRQYPRWWAPTLIVLLSVYAVLTVLVIVGSPLDRLDAFLYAQKFVPKSSPWHRPVMDWVGIAQGVPCSTVAALYAIRRSATLRSWRPWVMFTLALFGLNVSVGAMKHATGRIGPLYTDQVHTVWAGGTIFPSGHAANAVVMYGLIAMLVPVARRKVTTAIAVVIAATVGAGTVLINTHWVSDVFGGWIAGFLVLQLVWLVEPWATRLVDRTARRILPTVRRGWVFVQDVAQALVAPAPLEPATTHRSTWTVPAVGAAPDPRVGLLADAAGSAGAVPVGATASTPAPGPTLAGPSSGGGDADAAATAAGHGASVLDRPIRGSGHAAPRRQRTVAIPATGLSGRRARSHVHH